eukprot:TRINITY_DN27605_c0_g1_i2.p1 TRINITY_DN27605_c0_g1~~TRINITY_DN27605_c0_g1_i2.p1  ORF type:complete len:175 (-),score=23.49 TRINITY_DN27605_c0_g1_i2:132-656(-)
MVVLAAAASHGSVVVSAIPTEFLTDKSVNLLCSYSQEHKEYTPLMCAVAARLPELITLMLHLGVDPHTSIAGNFALSVAADDIEHPYYGIYGYRAGCTSDTLPVCEQTLKLVQNSLVWSPEAHHLYPPAFRVGIRSLLPLLRHVTHSLWPVIVAHLPRDWSLTEGQLAEAVDND